MTQTTRLSTRLVLCQCADCIATPNPEHSENTDYIYTVYTKANTVLKLGVNSMAGLDVSRHKIKGGYLKCHLSETYYW
jgi:hypothetical protein